MKRINTPNNYCIKHDINARISCVCADYFSNAAPVSVPAVIVNINYDLHTFYAVREKQRKIEKYAARYGYTVHYSNDGLNGCYHTVFVDTNDYKRYLNYRYFQDLSIDYIDHFIHDHYKYSILHPAHFNKKISRIMNIFEKRYNATI